MVNIFSVERSSQESRGFSYERFKFKEDGHDVNSEYGTVEHQYPNLNMKLRITYVGDENSKIVFKCEDVDKKYGEFCVNNEYTVKYSVFRKK